LTAEQIEYQKMMGKTGAKARVSPRCRWVRPSSSSSVTRFMTRPERQGHRHQPDTRWPRRPRILLAVLVAHPGVCDRHVATAAPRFDLHPGAQKPISPLAWMPLALLHHQGPSVRHI
jgi:hypothetical protein